MPELTPFEQHLIELQTLTTSYAITHGIQPNQLLAILCIQYVSMGYTIGVKPGDLKTHVDQAWTTITTNAESREA